jgi:hypothetical protein
MASTFVTALLAIVLICFTCACNTSPAPLQAPEAAVAAAAAAAAVAAVSSNPSMIESGESVVPNYIVGWLVQSAGHQMSLQSSLPAASGRAHLLPILLPTASNKLNSSVSPSSNIPRIPCDTSADCANHDIALFCGKFFRCSSSSHSIKMTPSVDD